MGRLDAPGSDPGTDLASRKNGEFMILFHRNRMFSGDRIQQFLNGQLVGRRIEIEVACDAAAMAAFRIHLEIGFDLF